MSKIEILEAKIAICAPLTPDQYHQYQDQHQVSKEIKIVNTKYQRPAKYLDGLRLRQSPKGRWTIIVDNYSKQLNNKTKVICANSKFELRNVHPWKIFTPEKYSHMKNIHTWKIFIPEKYSPLRNVHPWKIFTPGKYPPTETYLQNSQLFHKIGEKKKERGCDHIGASGPAAPSPAHGQTSDQHVVHISRLTILIKCHF